MRKILAVLVLLLALGIGSMQCMECVGASLPLEKEMSWWTVFYERPNQERLPVKVHFRLVKGLEYSWERR